MQTLEGILYVFETPQNSICIVKMTFNNLFYLHKSLQNIQIQKIPEGAWITQQPWGHYT